MTTSYLFAYYTLDSQVSLSTCMIIKTGLLLFLTFCCIISQISGVIDHYCIIENFKKIGRKEQQTKNNILCKS